MSSGLLSVLCLCLVVPMATGLTCYSCIGSIAAGSANSCTDAKVSDIQSVTCGTPAAGKEYKCALYSGEGEVISVDFKKVSRQCELVVAGTADTCVDSDDTSIFKAVISDYTGKRCYCSTDKCNGQTTLAPAMITSLFGLVLTVYAIM